MIFVTTGQRIAVENFSKGAIYKVTFTDESISYMMCVGIGKDFVMLQSTDPLLFSLTMQSASRVSTIDVHDPTPPEPPTPIENALQYQTGEPPFTFTTTENSLFSWYIEGEAGVKTANLLDYTKSETGGIDSSGNLVPSPNLWRSTVYIEIDNTENYTISFEQITNLSKVRINYYQADKTHISRQEIDALTVDKGQLVIPNNAAYIKWTLYSLAAIDISFVSNLKLMLNEGSTAIPYEPFGFKISISTNEHTTTIYLDEPIAEGEKLYSVNVDAQIVTDIGENTLSVSDPQPPEMQIVYGIYAEA